MYREITRLTALTQLNHKQYALSTYVCTYVHVNKVTVGNVYKFYNNHCFHWHWIYILGYLKLPLSI